MSKENQHVEQIGSNRSRHIQPVGGEIIGGDKISLGNISDSYTAIGSGAQVIVTQIQQALSAVDEMEKGIQVAERKLAEAIQQKLARYTKLNVKNILDDRGNPYKALLDYKMEDAPFFYGRQAAIQAMQEKMRYSHLTILESDSGAGKTSLLQAGLAARILVEGHFPLYLRPYKQPPAQYIKKAFLPDYTTQEELARFRDDEMTLLGFLERVTYYLGGRHLIIFLDQFEEFFTELPPSEQQRFAAQLHECVQSDLPIWWVLAIRKEHLSDLRLFQALRPFENKYYLPTFKLEEAQEVIIEPAALKNVRYEAGLVSRILDDIRLQSDRIPPTQVQLVCFTLFEELAQETNPTQISHALYEKPRGQSGAGLPGAEGILTSHLTRVLDSELKGHERKVASRLLEALVTSDLRRVVRSKKSLLDSLAPEQPQRLDLILEVLYENRLLRRELDENDEPLYELTHDYLLTEIQLDPGTQARKLAEEMLAYDLWVYQQNLPDKEILIAEDRFNIINDQRDALKLDKEAQELLDKSQQKIAAQRQHELTQERALAAEQRQRAQEAEAAASHQRRLTRIALGILVVALIAAALAVVFGVQSNENATQADDNAATAVAERVLADDARGTAEAEAIRADANAAEAIIERDRAEKQTRFALGQSLAALAPQVMATSADGETELAALLVMESIRIAGDQAPRNAWLVDDSLRSILEQPHFNNLLTGHEDEVILVAFDQDGQTLASFSEDHMLRLWNLVDPGAEPFLITSIEESISSVTFSPDVTIFASTSNNGVIQIWDLSHPTAEPVHLSSAQGCDNSVTFSLDGQTLAASNDDHIICLWNLAAPAAQPLLLDSRKDEVTSIAFSPNGETLASGNDDGKIWLWNLAERTSLPLSLDGHEGGIRSIAFSPDGQTLASASVDRTIQLWDLFDLASEPIPLASPGSIVRSVTFSPDGKSLVSRGMAHTIKLWDLTNLAAQPQLLAGHKARVRSVAFSPDGQTLASGSNDHTIRLWNLASPAAQPIPLTGHEGWVLSLIFNSDGQALDSASEFSQILFNLAETSAEPTLSTDFEDNMLLAAFSPDRRFLASTTTTTTGDDIIQLWHIATPDVAPLILTSNGGSIEAMAFSPDGQTLATATSDQLIQLWNMSDPMTQPAVLESHQDTFYAMAFSPDGKTLASGGLDQMIQLWNLDDPTAKPFLLPGHEDIIWTVTFSPDGKTLASGSGDGVIRLWNLVEDTANSRLLAKLENSINTLAFSSDGKMLASGSTDQTLRLWNLDDPLAEPILLTGHETGVASIAFSPDGQTLASGSFDNILLWVLPEQLLTLGCQVVRRNLSWQEWQRYLPGQQYGCTCGDLPPHWTVLESVEEGIAELDESSCNLYP